MIDMIACMGGKCPKREDCAHFHADYPARANPVERLCKGPNFVMFFRKQRDYLLFSEIRGAQ